jgi:flagellar basal-body rod modification protein FlgD
MPEMSTTAAAVTSLLPGGDPFAARPAAANQNEAATKEVFLRLLVAQIKNQNPLDPADGVEFVAQLAQFTQLEQTIGMAQNIDSLRRDVEKIVKAADSNP